MITMCMCAHICVYVGVRVCTCLCACVPWNSARPLSISVCTSATRLKLPLRANEEAIDAPPMRNTFSGPAGMAARGAES